MKIAPGEAEHGEQGDEDLVERFERARKMRIRIRRMTGEGLCELVEPR